MVELVAPSERYKTSFLAAGAEYAAEGGTFDIDENSFSALLEQFADHAAGRNLRPDRVPETVYWLVDGDEYLGRISVRHTLNDALRVLGGHVGYVVRPSRRREGHGRRMLELVIPKLAALGVDPALVTCDEDNIASRKIIERCGGVVATDVIVPGTLRYWLPTR